MSEQPSPTNPTDTSEKAEFGGINLLIGFVIGTALQFGWWALLDRLQLRTIDPSNTSYFEQFLMVIRQSHTTGFLLGAVAGATSNPANKPIKSVIWKAIRWAIGFSLALYGLDVIRYVLQAALGESLGDIVASAIYFGLVGVFVGLVLVLKQTVSPNIETAPLSIRQLVRWALAVDRSAVPRVLIIVLFGALLGITIEMLLQRLSAWPLLFMLDAIVAALAVRMWRPSQKTLRQWAIGALTLIIVVGLLLLLALSAQLGVMAGIVVLVVIVVIQSRKDMAG